MISAVAARKAALAAASAGAVPSVSAVQTSSRNGESQNGARSSPKSGDLETQPRNPAAKPTSKRKPPSEPFSSAENRKKARVKGRDDQKQRPKSEAKRKGGGKQQQVRREQRPRYFAARREVGAGAGAGVDAFRQQADVIEFESDSDSEDSDQFGSDFDENGSGVVSSDGLSEPDVPAPAKPRLRARASASYSGSDSSEDEDDVSMDVDQAHQDTRPVEVTLSTFFPQPTIPASSDGEVVRLSTFQPVLDENLFVLSLEEIAKLKIPSSPSTSTSPPPATTVVCLPPHDTICLLGACSLTVLHGSITICGTTLRPSLHPHRIFAPSSSPLPAIRQSFDGTTENGAAPSLLAECNLPQRVTADGELVATGAFLLLQELRTEVEGLGKVFRPFGGVFKPSKWQWTANKDGQRSNVFKIPGLHLVRNQSKDVEPYVLPHSWTEALEKCAPVLQRAPEVDDSCNVYLVKGPRNSGKSTFARTLLNRLLGIYERVAFLECDLGQSEFTPGGMVALNIISSPLFGPPFTHPTLPAAAHYIGSSTPRSSPSHYLEAVQALLQLYQTELQTPSDELLAAQRTLDDASNHRHLRPETEDKIRHIIPLIVNTMGWSKGLGADLTQKIEEWATPTDIFTFEPVEDAPSSTPSLGTRHRAGPFRAFHSASAPLGSLVDQGEDSGNQRVYRLDMPSSLLRVTASGGKQPGAAFTPADHRTLSILSYFHAVFPSPPALPMPSYHPSSSSPAYRLSLGQCTAQTWDVSVPLLAFRPYEVDCGLALDKIVLTGSGSEDVVPSEVGRVLNGALVGVVSCQEGAFSQSPVPVPAPSPPGRSASESDPRSTGSSTRTELPYSQGCTAPAPSASTCVGLAIVRGVAPHLVEDLDLDNGTDMAIADDGDETSPNSRKPLLLQVLTPLPPTELESSRVFVKGEMELPVWGMLDFRAWAAHGDEEEEGGREVDIERVSVDQEGTPFLQWGRGAGALGAEKRRVRRNLMRRGQM